MAQSEESSDILATASCEDKYIALSQWWERHNKSFSEWFLRLTAVQQRQVSKITQYLSPRINQYWMIMISFSPDRPSSFTRYFLNLKLFEVCIFISHLRLIRLDMPLNTPGSREAAKVALKATDMILPELSQEALLAAGGKLLVLLVTRRLVSQVRCQIFANFGIS